MGKCKARTKSGSQCGNKAVKGTRKCYRHTDADEVRWWSLFNNAVVNNKPLLAWATLIALIPGILSFGPLEDWVREQWRESRKPILEMAEIDGKPGKVQIDNYVLGGHVIVRFWLKNTGKSQATILAQSSDAELGPPDAEGKLHPGPWKTTHEQVNQAPMLVELFTTDTVTAATDPRLDKPGSIAALARVRYQDSDGHQYESDICFVQWHGEVLNNCKNHFHGIIDCNKEKCESF